MTPTIICHRGWWTTPAEQNTLDAFSRAFDAGLGVELDVRDVWDEESGTGWLAVSHDPIVTGEVAGKCFPFQKVLDLLGDRPNVLAVNVKSCGLAPLFAACKAPKNWFFFDVAPGDEEHYPRHKLPLFVRESWDEANPILTISPEIFGISHLDHWRSVRGVELTPIYLVTDRPAEAMEFFK